MWKKLQKIQWKILKFSTQIWLKWGFFVWFSHPIAAGISYLHSFCFINWKKRARGKWNFKKFPTHMRASVGACAEQWMWVEAWKSLHSYVPFADKLNVKQVAFESFFTLFSPIVIKISYTFCSSAQCIAFPLFNTRILVEMKFPKLFTSQPFVPFFVLPDLFSDTQ